MLWAAVVVCAMAAPKPAGVEAPINADPDRLKLVPVALRVKLDAPLGGETGVMWYRVKVLGVIKNESKQTFGTTLQVATYNPKGPAGGAVPGPPADECTVYLETMRNTGLWALLGGSADKGVSDTAKPGK